MTCQVLTGDIFAIPCDSIVIPVNCEGAMGAGVAWVVREYYPLVYRAYKAHCLQGLYIPGKACVYRQYASNNKVFVCLATKDRWQGASSIDYIISCLETLTKHATRFTGLTLNFPLLGAGHGLQDAQSVLKLMQDYLSNPALGFNSNIVLYDKGRQTNARMSLL